MYRSESQLRCGPTCFDRTQEAYQNHDIIPSNLWQKEICRSQLRRACRWHQGTKSSIPYTQKINSKKIVEDSGYLTWYTTVSILHKSKGSEQKNTAGALQYFNAWIHIIYARKSISIVLNSKNASTMMISDNIKNSKYVQYFDHRV